MRAPLKDLCRFPQCLWCIVLIYYMIGLSGLVWEPLRTLSFRVINSGPERDFSERSLIESLEAVLWLAASATWFLALRKRVSQKKGVRWILFFGLLCFAAFGEETSWGQQWFRYSTPDPYSRINAQSEVNIHNLNLSRALDIAETSSFYPRLKNLAGILNPAFYLLCITFWLVIPSKPLAHLRVFNGYPIPPDSFRRRFLASTVVYLLLDFLLFDAGEIFEFTLALAAFLAAYYSLMGVGPKQAPIARCLKTEQPPNVAPRFADRFENNRL